nr:hypothetical protein [Tanacetum cinerariifolium]
MVVPLSFTVNLYHDRLFMVNHLEYVHFESRVIDDVSFDDDDLGQFVKACYENNLKIDLFTYHNSYDSIEMIHDDQHPKKHVGHVDSDSDGQTNVLLDDRWNTTKGFRGIG